MESEHVVSLADGSSVFLSRLPPSWELTTECVLVHYQLLSHAQLLLLKDADLGHCALRLAWSLISSYLITSQMDSDLSFLNMLALGLTLC